MEALEMAEAFREEVEQYQIGMELFNQELENALRFLNFKQCSQLVFYLEYYIRNVRINIFSHHL